MIELEQPSLAISTFNVPGPTYRMEHTVKLTKHACALTVAHQIQLAVTQTPQSYLKNVVINSHGGSGYLYIGETKVKYVDASGKRQKESLHEGIGIEDVGLFTSLRGQIGTIWIVGCKVSGPNGNHYRVGGKTTRIHGNLCPQLAITIGCNVIAANVFQIVNPFRPVPENCIHEYDGTAYIWDANGKKEVYQQGKRI
jgi:hypothetical protein